MIKRLFVIGILTGIGHIGTIMSLKFIAKNVANKTIAFIGEIDSFSLMVISIIAFGLQLSTTRQLALLNDWKEEYYSTQSARFTLSLFLMFFGFFGFLFTKNFLFFMAPVFALNADYALYGLGKPVMGAKIALLRIIIPAVTLVISSFYFIEHIVLLYSLSLVVAYLFTGILVSKILEVRYFVTPKIKLIKKYLANIRIGLASFSFFFIGIGIVNVMSLFYNDEAIAVSYLALKLYMIYKGVRRIIVQAFFKELISDDIAMKVDLFAMIIGIVFLISLLFFNQVVISLFFDDRYSSYSLTFLLLGIAGFVSSISSSSETKLLLLKRDKQYSTNPLIAALIAIVSGIILWFVFGNHPYLIALSILIGETVLSILSIIAINEKGFIYKRLSIFYPILLMSLLFVPFKMYFEQNLFNLFSSMIIFGLAILLYLKKYMKTV